MIEIKPNFFQEICSLENLLLAWKEFKRNKSSRKDVEEFQLYLMDNIIFLHRDLMSKKYIHGLYEAFNISDPKPRNIHKASVRDRLLHHAIYRVLYPYFDTLFIHDSYSCRKNKGTRRAVNRFREFAGKVSKNNTRQCFVLKCDIRKFFASINHERLLEILEYNKLDKDTLWLLGRIIQSFETTPNTGLPLGNLTSQLLVNIYMNEFDQYVKHRLKVKYYIRYADDFVILSNNKPELHNLLQYIVVNLKDNLLLDLHPDKVYIKTYSSGVDFLGWVNFPHHKVLRTVTKRRMLKNITNNPKQETTASYLGLLMHGNAHKLSKMILENK